MAKTVKGRVGWEVVKKLLRAIPVIGPVFTVGFAGHDIKKKDLSPVRFMWDWISSPWWVRRKMWWRSSPAIDTG